MFSFLRRLIGGDGVRERRSQAPLADVVSPTDRRDQKDIASSFPAPSRSTIALLTQCEAELQRSARAEWRFVSVPRDVAIRAELLAKAAAAGITDAQVVQQLAFLHRLISALNQSLDLVTIDALLTDARQSQIADCSALRELVTVAESATFAEQGLRPIDHTADGQAVYLRRDVELRNNPGQLEVRDDGVCFRGEVLLDIPWSNVQHVAETSHTYQGLDYVAVAIQEGKRRTPTKFAFPQQRGAQHACKVVIAAWERAKQRPQKETTAAPTGPPPPQIAGSQPWTGYGYLAVVGESQYQDALARIGEKIQTCSATLLPEPSNPFDGNAVVVQIDGMTVGYLCRADARRYQRRLLALTVPMQVPAKLIGGTADKPSYGVLLDHRDVERLPAPKRTRAKKQQPVDPTDQPF